ncbi:MAG: hypothetical protein KGS61_08290, partial [Verrucomicrobia bacterium]|nr:hypothetical protein [Verrucomicrobiota bacterium]
RAKANLPWGVVARAVEYRRGYPPTRTPSPRANWPLANCILSQGLVSKVGEVRLRDAWKPSILDRWRFGRHGEQIRFA